VLPGRSLAYRLAVVAVTFALAGFVIGSFLLLRMIQPPAQQEAADGVSNREHS